MGFQIVAEPSRCLIRIRIEGMLSIADVERFGLEERIAIEQMGDLREGYEVIVDLTDYQVQSQSSVDAFHALLSKKPVRPARLTIITPSALLRMQLRRMTGRDDIRFCQSANELDTA